MFGFRSGSPIIFQQAELHHLPRKSKNRRCSDLFLTSQLASWYGSDWCLVENENINLNHTHIQDMIRYTYIYIYVLYHCFWSPSFPINSSPSNMATVVAQVIVQATGNALTKAVTAAEVPLLKIPYGKNSQRPIVGGFRWPKFHYYADKQMIETNQVMHGTKGDYNSPDWFWETKQDPYHHWGIWGRDCHRSSSAVSRACIKSQSWRRWLVEGWYVLMIA